MSKSDGNFDISADLAAIRQDMSKLTERISNMAQYQADSLGRGMANGVDEAKAVIGSLADDARHSVINATKEAQAAIEHNPLTTALVVFGIGVSLGLLSRPRA